MILTLIFYCFFHLNTQGQILGDEETQDLLREGTDAIYRMDFDESKKYIEELEGKLNEHPVIPLMKAYQIYWQNIPMYPESEVANEYQAFLEKAVERAHVMLEKDRENPEAIFYALSAHGLMTKYYGDEHEFTRTIREARKAYKYLKEGFDMGEQYPEFYFYTGLYNFYRERYPESHPVIKPFVWVFMNGNIEKGIEELKMAAEQAAITRPEAYKYLAIIYMKYLFQPGQALPFSKELDERYPENYYFKSLYTENLIELSQYKKALPHIEQLIKDDNPLYKMTGQVFKGLYFEKEVGDLNIAEQYYNQAKQTGAKLPLNAQNYVSFAYAGLARIAISKGNHEQAKEYYKKAQELAHYDKVKMEADNYFSNQ